MGRQLYMMKQGGDPPRVADSQAVNQEENKDEEGKETKKARKRKPEDELPPKRPRKAARKNMSEKDERKKFAKKAASRFNEIAFQDRSIQTVDIQKTVSLLVKQGAIASITLNSNVNRAMTLESEALPPEFLNCLYQAREDLIQDDEAQGDHIRTSINLPFKPDPRKAGLSAEVKMELEEIEHEEKKKKKRRAKGKKSEDDPLEPSNSKKEDDDESSNPGNTDGSGSDGDHRGGRGSGGNDDQNGGGGGVSQRSQTQEATDGDLPMEAQHTTLASIGTEYDDDSKGDLPMATIDTEYDNESIYSNESAKLATKEWNGKWISLDEDLPQEQQDQQHLYRSISFEEEEESPEVYHGKNPQQFTISKTISNHGEHEDGEDEFSRESTTTFMIFEKAIHI